MVWKKAGWLSWGFVVVVVVGALFFRLHDLEKRTFWNVDQSLTMWQIKKVVVDHKLSLIGLHFFSLADGAVWRTPFYNWLMAGATMILGLKVRVMSLIYALASLTSMGLVAKTAERFGGGTAGKLALILYAFSWRLAWSEMVIRPVTLMILMSSFLMWWLVGMRRKAKTGDLATGLVLGFGFSLHLSVMFLIMGVAAYLLAVDKVKSIKSILLIGVGVGLMLSPLAVFNLRHEMIMNKGVVRMLTGKAVDEGRASFGQRLDIATDTVSCQTGRLVGFGCADFLPLGLVVGLGLLMLLMRNETKNMAIYGLSLILTAMLGVGLSGRLGYSSDFYMTYLLPIWVVLGALVLARIFESRLWLVGGVLMVVVLQANITRLVNYRDNNSYYYKKRLAEFVYNLETNGRIGVKFWDQETLAYDFVFWEVAQEMGLPYEKVNLIELWGDDQADMVVYLNKKPDVEGKKEYKFGDSKLVVY